MIIYRAYHGYKRIGKLTIAIVERKLYSLMIRSR